MSYFFSPVAEYRAKRIVQMLAQKGEYHVAAQRDGKVMANFNGHVHLFKLEDHDTLVQIDHADITRSKSEAGKTEITLV